MAKANEVRPIVTMRSAAGTGTTYVTRKSRRSDPDVRTERYEFDGRLIRLRLPGGHHVQLVTGTRFLAAPGVV